MAKVDYRLQRTNDKDHNTDFQRFNFFEEEIDNTMQKRINARSNYKDQLTT